MPAREINHYLVYEITGGGGGAADVELHGTFDPAPAPASIGGVEYFANPCDKRHGDRRARIEDEHAHFAWHVLTADPEPGRELRGGTQFGPLQMTLGQPVALLVPAEKVEAGSQRSEDVGHYKVYEIGQCTDPEAAVGLRDQFFGIQTGLHGARFLAVPAAKTHDGDEFPVDGDDPALTFYAIDESEPGQQRQIVDQFGTYDLDFVRTVYLGVPTRITEWREA